MDNWQKEICEGLAGEYGVKRMEQAMVELITEFLELGVDPNQQDQEWHRPLWHSALDCDGAPLSVIELFFKYGATAEYESEIWNPPLIQALKCKREQPIIEFLLAQGAGASPNKRDSSRGIYLACEREYDLSLFKALVELGFPVDIPQIYKQETPLLRVCYLGLAYEIIEYLLDQGASVKHVDDEGNTALTHLCAGTRDSKLERVELLLKRGADVRAVTTQGFSALGYECKHDGEIVVIKALVNAGADVNAIENGYSMAMLAVEENNIDAIETLVELGFTQFYHTHPETGMNAFDLCKNSEDRETLRKLFGK